MELLMTPLASTLHGRSAQSASICLPASLPKVPSGIVI